MKLGKSFWLCLFVFGCLILNCGGKALAEFWGLPLWLDALGTVLAAYALGPFCGAVIGEATNIIYGIYSPIAFLYVLTNISVGIIVGIFEKKGLLKDLFGFLSTAFVITIVSVAVSTPLNFLLADGNVGNMWGDGMIAFCRTLGLNNTVSCIVGEFYMDFLDKTLTMVLFFLIVRLMNRNKDKPAKEKKSLKNKTNTVSAILAVLLVSSVFCPLDFTSAAADGTNGSDNDFDKYIRKVYNRDNGLPGGMANDIVQTKDGVLWIGTYGGLYRYCGNSIEWMNNIKSIKTVNCLYTDEAGRLWIGTNDNGLAIYINDKITNELTKYDGFPSNSVRCITEGSNGFYYAGTTDSLVVLTMSGGLKVYDTIREIVYAKRICADKNGNVAAVTDEGSLYLIKGTEVIAKITPDRHSESFRSCTFDENGALYVGSSLNTVKKYDISEGTFKELASIECGQLAGINSLTCSDDGRLFLCAENGAGYITGGNEYHSIDVSGFNSSIENMLIDYQGNLWFTSSRLGLLCLCRSVFTEMNESDGLSGNVVNTVAKWQGTLYFGTDSGLEAANYNQSEISTRLVEALDGVRIRCLMSDSENNLWICTSGKGVWEVAPNGNIEKYDSSNGALGEKFRSAIELKDGTIAAAGDYGVSFINNGKVIDAIGSSEGLTNPKLLTLCEKTDGSILAGTDGNGIAVIKDGRIVQEIKQEDGLSSDIILRIVKNSDDDGYFIVTGNGLCYLNSENKIRILNNFPYYNNYDVIEGNRNELFVLCSAGIFVVDKTELLAGGNVNYLLLDAKKGLRIALTPNSWNYIDENDNLYLSGDTGAVYFNINEYDFSMRSYRVLLNEIVADGESFLIEKGAQTVIPAGTSEIVFTPEIVNFSVNDPDISVYLEGFDAEPRVMPQSEMESITYSNIPSGEYVFRLAILDSRTGNAIAENTYKLSKEREIYDNWWFRLYAGTVAVIAIAYLTWLIFRTQIQKTLRMQKMELDFAKNQIKMGNETILTIAQAVDAKDENTSQHSVRVSEYSVMIAKELGYSDEQCENLRKIAILHDIGKIGIPDRVLNKPAKLTDEEYAIMKSHVIRGAEILRNFTMIENVADGALYHHERYDGRGYANGLKGEEIPLNARIIGIADAFDAMTANRVYRKKLDLDYVIEELKKGRGTQFDPKLVDIMLKLIENGTVDVEQIYGKKLSEEYANEI